MIIEKDFGLKLVVATANKGGLEAGDRVFLEVCANRRRIEVRDVHGELAGEVDWDDSEFVMLLLFRFSYADLNLYVAVNYDEEGGRLVMLHVWAKVNILGDNDRVWVNAHYW